MRERVPRERHRQIAESILVESGDRVWTIRWRDGQEDRSYNIDKDRIAFYRRGDVRQASGASSDVYQSTEEVAAEFACFAYGLPSGSRVERRGFLQLEGIADAAGHLILIGMMVATAPTQLALPMSALGVALLVEFWFRKGKCLLPVAGIMLVFTGLPVFALATNLVLGVVHFLDPDPVLRPLRVAVQLLSALVAAVLAIGADTIVPSWWLIAVCPAAVIVTAISWVNGVHFRLVPLVFPSSVAALAVEGFPIASIIGVIGAGLIVLLRNAQEQLLRYCLVGVCNTFIAVSMMVLLSFLGAHYVLYTAAAYALAFINSYLMNAWWTFGLTRLSLGHFVEYAAWNLGVLLLAEGVQVVLIELIGTPEIHGVFSGMLFFTVVGFLVNKHLVFAKEYRPVWSTGLAKGVK
jgi:putative flippase GtrA